MCGIVGVVSREPVAMPERLESMRDQLTHRGPDDAGSWWDPSKRVGLAMRRLSIIDLSSAGHQPMRDERGELCVVFNGELYNFTDLRRELEQLGHRFRGGSDTEVLLAAYRQWGTTCLDRLIGMFVFALYDETKGTLFVARDRAGEKPLYFRLDGTDLAFASELKALLVLPHMPRRLDPVALEHYLMFGYVPGSLCILAGYQKLPPAHAFLFDSASGEMRTWRYWSLPEPPSLDTPIADEDAQAELEELLLDSVRRQMIADVPVGILLSGGIDSSLVTAMAARAGRRVRTFTIAFPGHGAYDEGPFARAVAEYFGTEHTELVADPATVDLLPQLARQYDEPVADSSIVPTYLVSRMIRQHATVALGGDGGDELFAGYLHYAWLLRQDSIRRKTPGIAREAVSRIARALPIGFRGRGYAVSLAGGPADGIAHVNTYFDASARKRLLRYQLSTNGLGPESFRRTLFRPEQSILQNATRIDFATYLPDDILVKVDRASMLTSLEVRAPWLDHRIIEFAFGRVPDRLKLAGGRKKILPRRLAARLLPPQLDLTRKQGFSLPLSRWFRGRWGEFMTDVVSQADPTLFDRRTIARLVANQRRGLANTQRIMALTLFELWRREYEVSL